MGFSFEVKESDLLGRVGTMTVKGKSLETPCLFPVVHPVVQSVSIREIRGVGFEGLMTNAYILRKRRAEEALQSGLHKLLDFDGVLMTDSGGYQVLEYGDLDVSYEQMAGFQSKIGSDLAVTLDRPTGYSASKRRARDTEEYSTRNALATLKEFGDSETTWIGPVQGGLFTEVLARSAKALVSGGFRFLALGSPVQVMENYMYTELVTMIAATRKNIPYSVPLHLFGAGHPHTMAISVALGCDTFDSASYILFARSGRYMTERGVSTLREMKYLPCSCPVCRGRSVKDLLDVEEHERTALLAVHNLHVLKKEVELCKEAITEGRLWDLVEERATAHPKLQAAFRNFPSLSKMLQPGTAALKDKGLFVRGDMDAARPELETARAYLGGALRRSSKTAVILEGNEPIPVGRFKLMKRSSLEGFDVYRLNPQLGPYPVELDFVYPFTQTVATDSPVDGGLIAQAVSALKKAGYSKVMLAAADGSVQTTVRNATSRRRPAAASPSPRTASSRPRGPRRP
jgi:7-cyano-7-deazaguanine tRNA-ribosyltransferase